MITIEGVPALVTPHFAYFRLSSESSELLEEHLLSLFVTRSKIQQVIEIFTSANNCQTGLVRRYPPERPSGFMAAPRREVQQSSRASIDVFRLLPVRLRNSMQRLCWVAPAYLTKSKSLHFSIHSRLYNCDAVGTFAEGLVGTSKCKLDVQQSVSMVFAPDTCFEHEGVKHHSSLHPFDRTS